ncbi:MAG: peptidoglycan DD-metalloendopeptidase family protein [Ignavibacteriae bacterium]|nr:peptidoglycan DD-metalloendopeptidase family protein [Ignavibacteriota bacterium]
MVKILDKKILLILFISTISLAQVSDKIGSKNTELKSLRVQITKLEGELNTLSKEEKSNLKVLKKMDQQNLLLGKKIKSLEKEEKNKTAIIKKVSNNIISLKRKIKKLQKKYSDYLIWTYKQGERSTLKYLLDAESFQQALVRYSYISHIHKANKSRSDEYFEMKSRFEKSVVTLTNEKKEKAKVIDEKGKEKKSLEQKRVAKKNVLSKLKKNKKNVITEITEKRKSEIRIKKMIADLIEKERLAEIERRERKLKGELDDYEPKFNYDSFENFAELKGKLSWPIKKSKVERGFGENKNKNTKTVTLNYGIDLSTKENSEVFAVAEGIVSMINWLPGFGSVMIVTHRNNFRTVYGHLTDINYLEGNKVEAGDIIGKVNSSLEGNILHFEIWDERNYQNPEEWLAKK